MPENPEAPKRRIKASVAIKRAVFYLTGLFILALAISIAVRSDLGVSPVSSMYLSLSNVTGIEFGNATMIVLCVYTLAQAAILRREFKWYQLLQILCAVLFGKFVTLTGGLVAFMQPSNYLERLGMIVLSTVLIAVAMKLYMLADLVPNPADGLVAVIAKKFNLKFANVKNVFDLSSVAVASALSLIFLGRLEGLREGTLLAALGVGRVIALIDRIDNGRLRRFVFEEVAAPAPCAEADAHS